MRRLATALVFVIASALLLVTLPAQGLTDDDDFYAPAAMSYVSWLGQALTLGDAYSKKAVDRAFKPNHEHPPVAKYVMGLSHAVFSRGLGLYGDLDGNRAGVALMSALLCALLTFVLWRPFGFTVALAAPALLLSMPRFFFHSQVATLDVPVSLGVVAVVVAFFFAERSHRWAVAAGVIFGLATAIKLNAPFALFACLIYLAVGRFRSLRLVDAAIKLPPIPRSVLYMVTLGPIVFFASWPWLWFETLKRTGAYIAFHMQHYPIYFFYQGEIFNKPFAPWHAPFVMAAGVTPLPVLVAGLVGTALACRSLYRLWRDQEEQTATIDRLLALVLLQMVVAIGIVAFSDVPKYGGAKLFLPFFPFFAILAAVGLSFMAGVLVNKGLAFSLSATITRPVQYAFGGLLLAALIPGVIGSVRFGGGFALSYYSAAVGGLDGATARGYERTYYDIADKELARWLVANADGKSVHFAPNHKEYIRTYRWLVRDGWVPRSLRLAKREGDADLIVLTHERRWRSYPGLLARFRDLEVLYEKRIDGVPLYTVYKR